MTTPPPHDVIVIGAGVIGVSIALALQSAGRDVLLADRSEPGQGASKGNAGAFAFADITPLATPGIIRSAPGWLLDPLGPLSIPPAYALAIAPWLLRFWRASRADRFPQLMQAQAALMALSRDALERQARAVDGEPLLQREGQLRLYQGAARFGRGAAYWEACRRHGVAFDLLDSPGAIAEIQPGLSPDFTHAGFTPDWINTRDPLLWVGRLLAAFRARGGEIVRFEAHALRSREDRVTLEGAGRALEAGHVVVAAGAWSRPLALSLGDRIPLETERGYNTTLPEGALDLRTHLTFADHGFVVSRIGGGVRVGGAVELGGLARPPDYRRADVLLDKAKRFLPGLGAEGGARWMGFRPSLPDSLPVIGRSRRAARVVYAFGHGHLGLTQAAGTAELVRALLCGGTPALDMRPFSAQRFAPLRGASALDSTTEPKG
jgi:D-amino-acid dehydrogenase